MHDVQSSLSCVLVHQQARPRFVKALGQYVEAAESLETILPMRLARGEGDEAAEVPWALEDMPTASFAQVGEGGEG